MTTTTYLELDDQATGANNNTWGDVADANFGILEQAIARYLGISTTGGTTTLTSSQNRYPIIRVTGVLVSNATITVRTAEKNWFVINDTTGNFTVTVKTSGGTGKTVPRGRGLKLYCDGTNVELVRDRGIPAAQAGGTVDAITATFEPATTSAEKQDGTLWIVEAAGANTSTTPTFNPDSTGALTIKKNGGQALAAGDIRAAGHKLLLCYDSSGGHVELLNPNFPTLGALASLNTVGTSQITDNSVTGAKIAMGSDAQGDILYYNGTDYARLAAGTSGQFLKTNGAGANPAWAAADAGMVFLGTITTTSGASQSLGSLSLGSYRQLYLVFDGVSSTNAAAYTLDGVTATKASGTAAGSVSGYLNLDLTTGIFNSITFGTGVGGQDGATWGDTSYSTATTSITVAPTAGTFDAGLVQVYGIKV